MIIRPQYRQEVDALMREMGDLLGGHSIGLGLDVATTENEKSNPSSLAVVEFDGAFYIARLVCRWKTSNDELTTMIVESAVDQVARRPAGGRAKKLCIDATSERFYATELSRRLAGKIPVEMVIASEAVQYGSEKMNMKALLGNQLTNALDDGKIALPPDKWIKEDFRLVLRDKGSFVTGTDGAGNHGDSFDAVKLAMRAATFNRGSGQIHTFQIGGQF